jgi:hypothetical protein
MSGSNPARGRRREKALRRHRAAALIASGIAVLAVAGTGAAAKPHKPPKPHPKLTLLTGTEQGVLRRKEIKVRVHTDRGSSVKVTNHFVVDGYPEDFPFDLRQQKARFHKRTAVVKFRLSQRQQEVLDFAIKTCRGATVYLHAEVGKRGSKSLTEALTIPRDCANTG